MVDAIFYLVWAGSICLVAVSIGQAFRHEHPLLRRG